jgi:hypothetical protein
MANKNNKSEKIMTPGVIATIVVCGILLVAVVLFSVITRSSAYLKQQEAVKVGDNVVNAVEFGYFYTTAYNSFINQYGNYLSLLGYDSSLTPANQTSKYGEQTWVEYFTEQASAAAVRQSVMLQEGKKAGFTVDEAKQTEYVNSAVTQIETYAALYGRTPASYLDAMYGNGMDMATFKKCIANEYYVSEYSNQVYENIEVSDEEIEEYKNENIATFTTFDGNLYTYSFKANDEESKAEALNNVNALIAAATSSEAFEQFVQNQIASKDTEDTEEEKETEIKDITVVDGAYVNTYTEDVQEWILSEERAAGDVEYFEGTNKYTVVYYDNTELKDYNLRDIELALVTFETVEDDEETDEDESEVSVKNREEARNTAQAFLDEFKAGEQTAEAFHALAQSKLEGEKPTLAGANSVDAITNEGNNPEIEKWLFDEARKVGDVEIVEVEGGYYIVYYAAENEAFWKVSSSVSVQNEKYTELYEGLVETYGVTYNEEVMDKVAF